jgi:hypothetical protein
MTPSSFLLPPSSLGTDQRELPLADPRPADPLFLAYSATRLSSHGITFEKARTTPHLRLPLERVARVLAAHEKGATP